MQKENNSISVMGFLNTPKEESSAKGAKPYSASVVVLTDDIRKYCPSGFFRVVVTANKKHEDRRWFIFDSANQSEYSSPNIVGAGTDDVALMTKGKIHQKNDKTGFFQKSEAISIDDIERNVGKFFVVRFYVDKADPAVGKVVAVKRGKPDKYRPPQPRQNTQSQDQQKPQGGAAGQAAAGGSGTPTMY